MADLIAKAQLRKAAASYQQQAEEYMRQALEMENRAMSLRVQAEVAAGCARAFLAECGDDGAAGGGEAQSTPPAVHQAPVEMPA